jgi:colanic acid/amylovoran biosynthesis protein
LNHEGREDLDIINRVNSRLSQRCPVISDINALEVKRVIGAAKIVVSSRFHGAVSGLSQAVPTFCTGWSHKYLELLQDYKVPEHLLRVDQPASALDTIRPYLDRSGAPYTELQAKLGSAMVLLEGQVQAMWSEILSGYAGQRRNNPPRG